MRRMSVEVDIAGEAAGESEAVTRGNLENFKRVLRRDSLIVVRPLRFGYYCILLRFATNRASHFNEVQGENWRGLVKKRVSRLVMFSAKNDCGVL